MPREEGDRPLRHKLQGDHPSLPPAWPAWGTEAGARGKEHPDTIPPSLEGCLGLLRGYSCRWKGGRQQGLLLQAGEPGAAGGGHRLAAQSPSWGL